MADLVNTGNKNTLLDNNLVVSSESVPAARVLVVDSVNNRVGINKITPTVDLDVTGSVAISSALAVQTNKLIVDSSGNVGINVTPSGTYRLEISGSVLFTGTLQAFGPTAGVTATSFETTDPNILLNRSGNDASSAGAGLTIQRTTTNALLTWNNTKSNFEAGLSSGATSLIRAGGNTDAAAISIGTSDAFGFNLRTNNTDRVQIASTGNVTVLNNMIVNGQITIDGQIIKNQGLPPGSVVPFMPGYFQNSSNGTFTSTFGSNTVASINTWLTSNGYDQWRVCDGTNYGTNGAAPVIGSAIFSGGTNRSVPQLTDQRFLSGATTVGSSGGTNSRVHTHAVPTALAAVTLSHTHTLASSVINYSPVSFPIDAYPATPTTGAAGPLSASTFTGNASFAHTHAAYSHQHPAGSYYANAVITSSGVQIATVPGHSFTADTQASGISVTPSSSSFTVGMPVLGSTSGAMQSGPTPAVTSSDLSTYAFNHSHNVTSHTHTFPHAHTATAAHSHGPGSHTHTLNSISIPTAQFSHTHTLGAATVTENRPQYLSCFYIMRVR